MIIINENEISARFRTNIYHIIRIYLFKFFFHLVLIYMSIKVVQYPLGNGVNVAPVSIKQYINNILYPRKYIKFNNLFL